MKGEKNIFLTDQSGLSKNTNKILSKNIPYKFFYWGPLLCVLKLKPSDLKKCAKFCSKKSSFVNETLAGNIKNEHYVSTYEYYKIMNPYLEAFRHSFKQWYGGHLTKPIRVVKAWVNFMVEGEYNPPHIHINCDFSSVLFVKIPENLKKENKKFLGTGGGPGSISFTYGEVQPYSLSARDIFPEEGDLFIFPSTLTHFVAPFMSKEERISVSANFKFE